MKVLIVCALVMVGAVLVKGAHELCGLSNDQIMAVAKCMGEKVDSKLAGRARDVISKLGGDVAQVLKKQCDANVDFGAAVDAVLSAEQAEAVRAAYRECRALQS